MSKESDYTCSVCNILLSETLFSVTGNDGKIYQSMHCNHCDHITLYPPPTTRELNDFYNYSEHRGGYSKARWGRWNKKHNFIRQLRMIGEYITPGKMLEVGCAEGTFLATAQQMGWEVYGVELSHPLSAIARNRHGLTAVFTGTIADAGFEDRKFDLIVLSHILEHFHDPYELLDEAVRVLHPGGIIFVAVPHINSRFIRVIEKLPSKKIQDKILICGGSIYPPNHLVAYSLESLRIALRKVGCKILAVNAKGRRRPLSSGFGEWALGYLFWLVGSVTGWQPILEVIVCKNEQG